MNWQTLKLLYIHEIRTLVRARRTVVMAIVIPTIVMPLMLFASKFANNQRQRALTHTTYLYTVTGSMTDRVRSLINAEKAALANDTSEDKESLKDFKILESPVSDPAASLEHDEIHFYIQTYSGKEADSLAAGKTDSDEDTPRSAGLLPSAKRLDGVPLMRVIYRGNTVASEGGSRQMVSFLRRAQKDDVHTMLVQRGFRADPN